jgi:phosphonatase-like hydrolase
VPALVVFDLAGTTIYDRGEVPDAFAAALRDDGVAFDEAELGTWRGASKREVLRHLLGDGAGRDRVEAVYARFRGELERRYAEAGTLSIPGVSEAMARLRAAAIRVAIATGFDGELARTVLAAVDWTDALDAIVGSDDVAEGRPAPYLIFRAMERCGVRDVRRVAAVGDTRLDLEAAWNAGVGWRIGVLGGAHDRAALERAPHTHLLQSAADVPGLWLG